MLLERELWLTSLPANFSTSPLYLCTVHWSIFCHIAALWSCVCKVSTFTHYIWPVLVFRVSIHLQFTSSRVLQQFLTLFRQSTFHRLTFCVCFMHASDSLITAAKICSKQTDLCVHMSVSVHAESMHNQFTGTAEGLLGPNIVFLGMAPHMHT